MRPRRKTSTSKINIDWPILGLVLILLAVGLVMVLNASIIDAFYDFGDRYFFLKRQALWATAGLASLLVAFRIPIKVWQQIAPMVFLGAIFLLLIVLIPGIGVEVYGARRWIDIAGFTIQPSELAKLAAVIYFPFWLTKHQRLGPFLFITGILIFLLLLEPDLGTAIIISLIASSMYFVSGAKIKDMAIIGVLGVSLGAMMIVISPYRFERLKTFLDPTADPLGASYHLRQILISLGSGGITGTGVGRSRQKYQYLPEASTDSIFAVIAEETGFIGASLIILIFAYLILRMTSKIKQINDQTAKLMAVGVVAWFAAQTLLNLAAMVSLVPLTGVPLPLVSYGGSSLLTILFAIGLFLQATKS